MPSVFISYRRNDTAGHAGRLFDRLAARFGRDHVFMDVDGIEPGQDFVKVITDRVGACDAIVVLIGPEWLTVLDANGRPKLDNPGDLVRREIAEALERGILLIPVLVEGARIPEAQRIPDEIRALVRHQAMNISDGRFHEEATELIYALERGLQLDPGAVATREGLTRGAAVGASTGVSRRILGRGAKRVLGIAALALCAVIAAFAVRAIGSGGLTGSGGAPSGLTGIWRGTVPTETGVPFDVVLNLQHSGRYLMGVVQYPTGTGRIVDGTVRGKHLRFMTVHVPDFENREVTTLYEGTVNQTSLELEMRYDDVVRTFTARRAR